MANRKRLQELTIKDNFMFGAVMMEEDNCRKFLELSLGFPIAHLEISREKNIQVRHRVLAARRALRRSFHLRASAIRRRYNFQQRMTIPCRKLYTIRNRREFA